MIKKYLIIVLSLIIAIAINTIFWISGTDIAELYKSLLKEEIPEAVPEEVTPTIEIEPDIEENDKVIPKVTNPRENSDDFQAGITFFLYEAEINEMHKITEMLDYLVQMNINSISLTFPIFQEDWKASELYIDEKLTPSNENLRLITQEAHNRQFTVLLRPILYEKTLLPDRHWRGSIQPIDVELWFESYTKIILDYAKLAQEEDIEILSIGVELNSLEHRINDWEKMIEEIREIYSGQLTYSQNWDVFGRNNLEFWNKLDFIGVDAFFPLQVGSDATLEELVEAWEPWIKAMNYLKEIEEKPIVLTEVGTMSQSGSFRAPWRWEHGTPIDLEAQANYYKATCIASKETVNGIYWWNIGLDFPENSQQSSSFNPIGKPAEDVIIECFSKPN